MKYNVESNLLKIPHFQTIEGWLTKREATGLFYYANKLKKSSIIVEIGSWKGKSTYCLAKGLKKGKIIAIDPFNADGEEGSKEIYEEKKGNSPIYFQFLANMHKMGIFDKITPYVGYSFEFKEFIDHIDLLFIDGDHGIEGCSRDFKDFSPKLKKGGYLLFHDYDPFRKDLGPTYTIDNLVIPSYKYKFIAKHDTLWVAKKVTHG